MKIKNDFCTEETRGVAKQNEINIGIGQKDLRNISISDIGKI